jgi:hypothetical protein
LQRFMAERLECRNISRNSLHRVLQKRRCERRDETVRRPEQPYAARRA